jgi:hypothetical protein
MDNTGFTINPKLYDFLKWMALTVLPAAVVLVSGLGLLLDWSQASVVAGSIALFDTFLGSLLSKSSKNYAEGQTLGDLIIGQDITGAPNGDMRVVATKESPIFQDGGHVRLNVKREMPIE